MTTRTAQPDCYSYVRHYYKVPAYIGVRVRLEGGAGRAGVLVRSRGDQYVYILLDGDKRTSGPYHPTDGLKYEIESVASLDQE